MKLRTNKQRYAATEMLCEMLGVSTQDVNDYIATGKLPKLPVKKEEKPKAEVKK